MASREITGVEALVRWQHRQRGLLTPDRFLDLFAQSGLMGPLALTVLDLALAQQTDWAREDVNLTMAVNLSAANPSDEQLPEKIFQVFDRWDADPGNVVLEITEDSLMLDAVGVEAFEDLQALLGVDHQARRM